MRWLIIRVAGFWFVIVVIVVATITIGQQQPSPEQFTMLHLSDCQPPCWIGIVPGKSTIAEAKDRLMTVYGWSDKYQMTIDPRSTSPLLAITLTKQPGSDPSMYIVLDSKRDNVIHTIMFDFYFDQIYSQTKVAELLDLLGTPVCLSKHYYSDSYALSFGDYLSGIWIDTEYKERIDSLAQVQTLWFYGNGRAELDPTGVYQDFDWRGFTTVQKYLDDTGSQDRCQLLQ
jgi:hypothetical protein